MANKRDLKKLLNYTFSDIIEDCYIWQLENADKSEKAEKIIDEAILSFDGLIAKVNVRKVENMKKHFKEITSDLEKAAKELDSKLAKL